MRYILYTTVILLHTLVYGQTDGLRIYVSDIENGKNITDAKVTLEGFELPEIKAIYNTEGHYYYIDKLPEGYNTVMAYHKGYNEKGYQKTEGLSTEVNLRLHSSRNVFYDFEKPVLTEISANYSRKNLYQKKLEKVLSMNEDGISLPSFRYLYQEDFYHIAILSEIPTESFFNDGLKKVLDNLSLEPSRTIVETGAGIMSRCFGVKSYGGSIYYDQNLYASLDSANECDKSMGFETAYRIYFFNKKNGEKLSRYNSVEIKKLREMGYTVAAITYRKIEYYGKEKFNPDIFFNMQSTFFKDDYVPAVTDYFLFNLPQKPFQTLYSNLKDDMSKRYDGVFYGSSDKDNIIYSLYLVMPRSGTEAIGLGILDIATKEDLISKYIFTNSFIK